MTGQNLRALRQRFGLDQVDVAQAAGFTRQELTAIENGSASDEAHRRVVDAIRSLIRPSQALTDEVRASLREVFTNYGAQNVRIFGSVARGTDRPGSDLDLMAVFNKGFSLFGLVQLIEELEGVVGVRVDVISDDEYPSATLVEARREAVPL